MVVNKSRWAMDLQSKQILLQGTLEDGLYKLSPVSKSLSPSVESHVAVFSASNSAPNWHIRLGHPAVATLQRILSQLQVSCPSVSSFCNACNVAKSHRLPFGLAETKSCKPFELIHSDVWGPSPLVSINGARYFLLFVDDYSRFSWLYLLKSKHEVFPCFVQFKKFVETQFETHIKSVQTDWGGEYRNVSSFLSSHGITHRVSCPHTPQQNGRVERKNRHVVEIGLSLLAHSSLPLTFWSYAFQTAIYLINRLPSSVLSFKCPYELLYKSSPDYSLLRCFGCACFPFLRPYNSHKLLFRSKECIFLGYSSNHKGYRCLDPVSGRLYISRHVIFNESSFPCSRERFCFGQVKASAPDHSFFSQYPFSLPSLTSTSSMASPSVPSPSFPPGFSPAVSKCVHHHPMSTPAAPTSSPSFSSPTSPTSTASPYSPSISSAPPLAQNQPSSTPILPVSTAPVQNILPLPPSAPSTLPSSSNIHPMVTRSKADIHKPKCWLSSVSHITSEPPTFKLVVKCAEWRDAMQKEFDALVTNNTWKLVPPFSAYKLISCKWVYRIKLRPNGEVERYKARLVARGFDQAYGIDYFETFSPVIKPATIRLVLSLAVNFKWVIRQLDVHNAFLNGDLHEDVYMVQPKGFVDKDRPEYVCKLQKALYGLKQSPREWFLKLSNCFLQWGFIASKSDASMFVFRKQSVLVIILVYVDDILVTGNDLVSIQRFISSLNSLFALKDLGDLSYFLGVEFHRGTDFLHMSQAKYFLDVLKRAEMLDCKPADSPMASGTVLSIADGELLSDPKQYRSLVGALQYCTITRPDLSFVVNKVCQFLHAPTSVHWNAVKRILRYLKATLSLGLTFSSSGHQSLVCYTDADWANCPDDRRSTSGYCIFLGNNLVSWSSAKQKVVSRSSAESEYRGMSNATAELIWLQSILTELGFPSSPPLLLCDNISATYLAANPVLHNRSKHIEIDHHFIRERVSRNQLLVRHVSSEEQLADIMTKPLHSARFQLLRTKLTVHVCPAMLAGDDKI